MNLSLKRLNCNLFLIIGIIPDFARNLSRDGVGLHEEKSWQEQSSFERLERLFKVALPYLQLYGPKIHPLISPSLTFCLNGKRFYHDISATKDVQAIVKTAVSLLAIFFLGSRYPGVSMALTALQDLAYDVQTFNSLESLFLVIKNLVYLSSLAQPKNLSLGAALYASTSLSYLFRSMKEAYYGRWLECLGNFGLFGIQMDRSMQTLGEVYPRPQGEVTPSSHTFRDIASRHLLYWSSLLRTPLDWTGWGGGFLGYFGPEDIAGRVAMRCRCKVLPKEADFLDSYWKEVSYRVALCVASTFVLPIAYPLAFVGTFLRVAGFMMQKGLCTLIQSKEDLKKFENSAQKHPATFGWLNACWIFAGHSRSHGGVADPSSRFKDLVGVIKEKDLTYFAMTEIYGVGDAEKFYQELKEIYPFAVIECPGDRYGAMLGATSGLAIFSKVPFMNIVAEGLSNSFVLQRKALIAADFSFDGIKEKVRILATHLTHSADDNRVNEEDAKVRTYQLNECLKQNPDIIVGDLNMKPSETIDFETLKNSTQPSIGLC